MRARTLALVYMLASGAACSDVAAPAGSPALKPANRRVASLVVSPSTATLVAGATAQLTATAYDVHDDIVSGATVEWSSSNPSVATTSASGLVTAVAAGSATITATSGRGSGSAAVTVSGVVSQPPTGGSAECASPRAGWIWCDDFEQDRLAKYFEYDHSSGKFVRATGVGHGGSVGMRALFALGQVSAGFLHLAFGKTPQSYFRPVDAGTANYREIYWRLYLKNQVGWIGGGGHKLSRAISFASPTSWAQAMIAHVWSGGTDGNHLVIDPASGTDAAGTLKTTKYNDFDNLRWLGLAVSKTAIFDAAHVGTWHCIEAHVRLNDAGAANGIFELWIDSALEASRTGLNWVGSYSEYGINALFVENWWGEQPVAQERYFDRLVVSTQRIGC